MLVKGLKMQMPYRLVRAALREEERRTPTQAMVTIVLLSADTSPQRVLVHTELNVCMHTEHINSENVQLHVFRHPREI
jgi:hypothetical protein